MLHTICHHTEPFAFFTAEDALPASLLSTLEALYSADLTWQHHTDSFYRAFLCDVSERIDPAVADALVQRMRHITGLSLTARLQVTIQRLESGQFAGPHTDRPLLGYEVARLIVQLSPDWKPEHGGELHLHRDEQGKQTVLCRPPRLNSAFGFIMGTQSFHSVQPTTRTRRTVVFNFWHTGNTEAIAAWVGQQFDGMRFDLLPESLDALIVEAEHTLSEDDTFRAACIAHLLQRWGLDEDEIAEGYRQGLNTAPGPDSPPAIALAWWAQRLKFALFDARQWAMLERTFQEALADPRLSEAAAWMMGRAFAH